MRDYWIGWLFMGTCALYSGIADAGEKGLAPEYAERVLIMMEDKSSFKLPDEVDLSDFEIVSTEALPFDVVFDLVARPAMDQGTPGALDTRLI